MGGLAATYVYHASPKSLHGAVAAVQNGVRETGRLLYSYAILPTVTVVLLSAAAFLFYRGYKWYRKSRQEHQRQLMQLVDQITDVIRDAQNGGIAEPHVRDL